MDPQIPLVIGAVGTAATAVLGGLALLYRSRAPIERAAQLLRRLHDWLDGAGLLDRVPPALRRDLTEALGLDPDEQEDET